ncbi:MAG: T9SS type A sorting domain-containing protein [Bacteroides sp.]|nr:T9SS type A sorting domain-containing protein [Bacteroides sp.]MCM1085536.1 T9SS type A sorting domain-containing protein [Bacteroides sp.]
MKTKFLKAFAAVMMAFSFAGFARAEDELEITASIANAGENVTLGEKTNNAYTATDVVLNATAGSETKLTLICEGADIYYTTDGTTVPSKPSEPAAKAGVSTKYTEAFVVTEDMKGTDGNIVIKAIAYKQAVDGSKASPATAEESEVLTITLTLKADEQEPSTPTVVNVPTFEVKNGAEADTIVVKMAGSDSIFVATGADSTAAVASVFTKYTADAKIAVNKDTVVVAYGVKGADKAKSDTVKYVYTKTTTTPDPETVAVPTFVVKNGAEVDTVVVVMATAEGVETYVAKGKDSASAAAFVKLTKNDTIFASKAQDTAVVVYAKKGTAFSDTVVAYKNTKATTPVDPETVAAPVANPAAGVVVLNTEVTLAKGTADSIFVAFGTTEANATAFEKQTADLKFKVTKDTVVRAYAMKANKFSDTVVYAYTWKPVAPEANVESGSKVDSASTVVILKGEADSIFVALGAATTFTKFDKNDTLTIVKDTTFRAYAVKGNRNSDTVTFTYTLKGNEPIVAVPTFNKMNDTTVVVVMPADVDSMMVAYAATEAAATAFTKFDKNDTIVLKEDAVIRAYAMKDGKYSDTAVYEFKKGPVAVEGKELAGVRVYPNPSNGQFNVCVPVNAVVEVFGLNGQMVKRVNVSAGENAMQIDNAGIYFVRVRANGQVSIKKVVVR